MSTIITVYDKRKVIFNMEQRTTDKRDRDQPRKRGAYFSYGTAKLISYYIHR